MLELRRSSRVLARTVEELTAARAELLRSNGELADFAGRASHDLRSPLVGVAGFLELLADHPAVASAPTAKRLVERGLGAAGRTHALVDELLEYVKRGGQLRWAPVDLGALLAGLVEDRAIGGAKCTSTAPVEGGAGIGPATCRRVVTAHGGTIGLDDGIDGGPAVWFALPPPERPHGPPRRSAHLGCGDA